MLTNLTKRKEDCGDEVVSIEDKQSRDLGLTPGFAWPIFVFHYFQCTLHSYKRPCCIYVSEYNPMPTDDITTNFNELRQDIVVLYELKLALATCDYELETLKHQYETLNPGKVTTEILYQSA